MARDIRAGRAFVELTVRDSKLLIGLNRAKARLQAFASTVGDVGAKLARFSAVSFIPFAIAVKIFTTLSDSLLALKGITGASEKEFADLSTTIKELGRTTSFTANEVASAAIELARAGFKPTQIQESLSAVLNLSRATRTELARSAEVVGQVLRGFNLEAADATKVVDILTVAANSSATTVDDLGESLKFVAPLASEAGESLEDTAAALAVLANNGLRGTIAGTSLSRAFKNLTKTLKQVKLRELGVEALDSAGNLRPIIEILKDIGAQTKDIGTGAKIGAFEEIFGRAAAAALKLGKTGFVFEELQAKLKNAGGEAARVAKIMDSGLGGAFRRLLSAVEGVAITVGEALAISLIDLAEAFRAIVGDVQAFIRANQGLVVSAVKILAIIGATGIALISFAIAIKITSIALATFLGIMTLVKVALVLLLSPIGLIAAAIVLWLPAIFSVISSFVILTDSGKEVVRFFAERFASLGAITRKALGGVVDALKAGDILLAAQILWTGLKLIWTVGTQELQTIFFALKNSLTKIVINISAFIQTLFTNMWAGIKEIFERGKKFVNDVFSGIQQISADIQFDLGIIDEKEFEDITNGLIDQMGEFKDQQKRDLDAIDKQRQASLKKIKEAQEAGLTGADIIQESDVQAIKDRIQELTRELGAQTNAAGKAKDEQAGTADEIENGADEAADLKKRIAETLERLKQGRRDFTGGGAGGKARAQGLFNIRALQSVGATAESIQERTAKATEATAKNTEIMARRDDVAFA